MESSWQNILFTNDSLNYFVRKTKVQHEFLVPHFYWQSMITGTHLRLGQRQWNSIQAIAVNAEYPEGSSIGVVLCGKTCYVAICVIAAFHKYWR